MNDATTAEKPDLAASCRQVAQHEIDHVKAHGWVKLDGFVTPDAAAYLLQRAKQILGEGPDAKIPPKGAGLPYFVPGKEGTAGLTALAKRGVKVRVLTNSLSATDVAPVHAGYAKYRRQLLEAGITLYELKPGAAVPPPGEDSRPRGLPGSGSTGGGSAASLHAKTFAADRKRLFVGSFNLDPRSARLNTEMGVIIDSPKLASRLSSQLDNHLPNAAYLVRLTPEGQMEWIERGADGQETRYTTEPGTSGMRRLWVDFLEILPIESLL